MMTEKHQEVFLTPGFINKLGEMRRYFHAHPELSEQEWETAKTVAKYLSGCKPNQLIEGLGGTGVAAVFDSGKKGKTVLLRADIDALPIQEVNNFPYKSKTAGVSHKCGHDGHTTILLGLATILSKDLPKKGKIILLFQPSEENGKGAAAVLKDERFAGLAPDFVFAFHNLPGYPLNEIVVRKNAFTAAVKSIIIRLKGKTAHAAEPEHGQNPALAIAEILKQADQFSNNDPSREDFAVITPIHIEMGKIYYGISAGYGELRLTMRAWTQKNLVQLESQVLNIIKTTAQHYKLGVETEFTHVFQANENDASAVEAIIASAEENGFSWSERAYPFKWGEDFGLFTQKFKGAMFGIGAGVGSPGLHNPDYDFPDDMIPVGISMFHGIMSEIL